MKHSKANTKHVCSVAYAALNFRDVMLATGKLAAEAIPGMFKPLSMLKTFLVDCIKITLTYYSVTLSCLG